MIIYPFMDIKTGHAHAQESGTTVVLRTKITETAELFHFERLLTPVSETAFRLQLIYF